MITFFNDFHRTFAKVRANEGETVSRRVYKRVCNELCGVRGCTCGTFRDFDNINKYRLEPTDETETEYRVVMVGK